MLGIEDYLARLPATHRQRGRALHRLVRRLFADAVVSFEYKMPTYRRADNFLSWSSKKRYFSIYTCSTQCIVAFRAKHPGVQAGAGWLKFRDQDEFPLADLAHVVRAALAPPARIRQAERAAARSRHAIGKRRAK